MASHSFPEISLDRLLRPLRSKCRCLAKIANMHASRHSLAHYYSSGPVQYTVGTWNDQLQGEVPPLFIFLPPTNSRRGSQNKQALGAANLTKAIYDVQAAFADVLSKISSNLPPKPHLKVISLSEMCSIILGQQISYTNQEDSSGTEDELTGEELYMSIPKSSRRYAVISHALEIILLDCPPIPTLLMVLLEISLKNSEQYCATQFLRALLHSAMATPSNSKIPKLCHKEHTTFIVDTFTKWNDHGFSPETFVRVLSETLIDNRSLSNLMSPAIDRFTKETLSQHGEYFIQYLFVPMVGLLDSWVREDIPTWEPLRPTKKTVSPPSAIDTLAGHMQQWAILLALQVIQPSSFHNPAGIEVAIQQLVMAMVGVVEASGMAGPLARFNESLSCLAALSAAYMKNPFFENLLAKLFFSDICFEQFLSAISLCRKERRKGHILSQFSQHQVIITHLSGRFEGMKISGLLSSLWTSTLRFFEELLTEHPDDEDLAEYVKQLESKAAETAQVGPPADQDEIPPPVAWPKRKRLMHSSARPGTGNGENTSLKSRKSFTSLLCSALANRSSVKRIRSQSTSSRTRRGRSPQRKRRRVTWAASYKESDFEGSDCEGVPIPSSDDPLDII